MKIRIAWLADAEDADSYSARETRVLLRALARRPQVVALWFALGSARPPHFWCGTRVFPVPVQCFGTAEFFATLVGQQRPHVLLSNLPHASFPAGFRWLADSNVKWIHRLNPSEGERDWPTAAAQVLAGDDRVAVPRSLRLPYVRGFDPAVKDGSDATTVLEQLERVLLDCNASGSLPPGPRRTDRGSRSAEATGHSGAARPRQSTNPPIHRSHHSVPTAGPYLVMRQQLFCNVSLAHVMFELTNALLELGVPTVPQDEPEILSKGFVDREEELFRAGAPEKYERVASALGQEYDPETAVTIHFSMLQPGSKYCHFGAFPSLTPREVLYTTGNHTAAPDGVRRLRSCFEMILGPSDHVLRPYLEAGLEPSRGAVIPHGVDPTIFVPTAAPLAYQTTKRFKFVQTSFPWIYEKGFDLSIKAFCRAFTSHDDVALILRIPRLRNPKERSARFEPLISMVNEERARQGAPEILLLESDVPLNQRGGVYTGADCYLFPLRAEGFGMTILEAMACGLPVIATAWSGPADFLSPRYTYTLRHSSPVPERASDGRLLRFHVEPDLDHLIHLLRHVYQHRDEAKAMGMKASDAARRDWTWKRAAEKLASLFFAPPPGRRVDPSQYAQRH